MALHFFPENFQEVPSFSHKRKGALAGLLASYLDFWI